MSCKLIEFAYDEDIKKISHLDVMEKLKKLLIKNKVLVADLQTEPRFQNGKLSKMPKESHISI